MEPAFAESQFRELRRVGDLWRSWIPDDRVSLIAVMNDTFYRYRALGFQLETIAYCMGIDVSVAWDCLRMEASRSKAIPSTKPPSTSPIRLVNLMDAGSNSIHSTSTSTSTMSGDHAVSVSTSDLISTTRQVIDSSRTWSHEGRAVLIALGSESSGHRLTTESAKIRQALAFIGSIRVVPIPQVGPDDFRAEVAKWNPWVLHVAAHADGDDVWLTEDNEAVPVNGEFWFDVFKTLDQRMMMVVLSYCNSAQLLQQCSARRSPASACR